MSSMTLKVGKGQPCTNSSLREGSNHAQAKTYCNSVNDLYYLAKWVKVNHVRTCWVGGEVLHLFLDIKKHCVCD